MKTRELLKQADQITISDVLEGAESPESLEEKGCTKVGEAEDEVKRVIVLLEEKTGNLRKKKISSLTMILDNRITCLQQIKDSLHADLTDDEILELVKSIHAKRDLTEDIIRIDGEIQEIQEDIERLREIRNEELKEFLESLCPVHHDGLQLASDWTVWIIPRTAPSSFAMDYVDEFFKRVYGLDPFGDETEGSEVGSSETEQGQDPSQDQSGQDEKETTKRRVYSPVE